MKIIGVFFILLCGGLFGIYFSKKLKDRMNNLQKIIYLFDFFATQIRFKALTSEEIIELLKDDAVCKDLEFIKNFDLNEDEPFELRWIKSIEISEILLKNDEKELLKAYGENIGTSDIQGQLKEIESFKSRFIYMLENAKVDFENKAKLYRSLGVIGGAFFAIILY